MMSPDPAGWFGKLPSLGDFASRRLPPDFLDGWDGWLARELGQWQAAAPAQWRDAYLHGPSWRFVLGAGALPGPAGRSLWAGTLMPSVDRVGRYFPFTLAMPLQRPPADTAEAGLLLAALHRLDDLALDALHEDWDVPTLEASLLQLAQAPDPEALPPAGPLAGLAAALCDPAATAGSSHWFRGSRRGGEPVLRRCRGLPACDVFTALFAAEPTERQREPAPDAPAPSFPQDLLP